MSAWGIAPDVAATERRLQWNEEPQEQAQWAESIASGDLDGDGISDLVVGSPTTGAGQSTPPHGRFYVYYGDSSGLQESSEQVVIGCCATFGQVVRSGGDVDGDGFDDVLVGVPTVSIVVYRGSPVGLDAAGTQRLAPASPIGDDVYDGFGTAAVFADVNGDGFDDVVAGQPTYLVGGVATGGSIYVFLGSAAGVDASSEHRISAPEDVRTSKFATDVVAAGDLNGDGFGDVVVAHELGDSVYVYYGSALGLSANSHQLLLPPAGSEGLFGGTYGLRTRVAGLGDIDNDGYADLAIIAPAHPRPTTPGSMGSVLVYFGGGGGLEPDPGWVLDPTNADDNQLTVAAAGDVDDDGFEDVLVGVYALSAPYEFGAYLHFGGPRTLGSTRVERLMDPTPSDENSYAKGSLTGGVDFDGDGVDDFAIGDARYNRSAGAVYLYSGIGQPTNIGATGDTGPNDGTSSEDTGGVTDTSSPTTPSTDNVSNTRSAGHSSGCGCSSSTQALGVALLLPLAWVRRRSSDTTLVVGRYV